MGREKGREGKGRALRLRSLPQVSLPKLLWKGAYREAAAASESPFGFERETFCSASSLQSLPSVTAVHRVWGRGEKNKHRTGASPLSYMGRGSGDHSVLLQPSSLHSQLPVVGSKQGCSALCPACCTEHSSEVPQSMQGSVGSGCVLVTR